MARRRKLKVETVPIEKLKPHPLNYKDHPDDQLDHIEAMLRAEGLYKNVVVAKDYTILAGHGVVKAASERLGWSEIEVERRPIAADSPRALKILVGDNAIPSLAFQDSDRMATILRSIQSADVPLVGSGFNNGMLEALLRTEDAPADFPEFDSKLPVQYECPKCSYRWS